MVWENVLDAICIVMDPEEPIVKLEGSVIEDALGIVVRSQVPLHDISPGPYEPSGILTDADRLTVFVPSLLCVTVVVPDLSSKDE